MIKQRLWTLLTLVIQQHFGPANSNQQLEVASLVRRHVEKAVALTSNGEIEPPLAAATEQDRKKLMRSAKASLEHDPVQQHRRTPRAAVVTASGLGEVHVQAQATTKIQVQLPARQAQAQLHKWPNTPASLVQAKLKTHQAPVAAEPAPVAAPVAVAPVAPAPVAAPVATAPAPAVAPAPAAVAEPAAAAAAPAAAAPTTDGSYSLSFILLSFILVAVLSAGLTLGVQVVRRRNRERTPNLDARRSLRWARNATFQGEDGTTYSDTEENTSGKNASVRSGSYNSSRSAKARSQSAEAGRASRDKGGRGSAEQRIGSEVLAPVQKPAPDAANKAGSPGSRARSTGNRSEPIGDANNSRYKRAPREQSIASSQGDSKDEAPMSPTLSEQVKLTGRNLGRRSSRPDGDHGLQRALPPKGGLRESVMSSEDDRKRSSSPKAARRQAARQAPEQAPEVVTGNGKDDEVEC